MVSPVSKKFPVPFIYTRIRASSGAIYANLGGLLFNLISTKLITPKVEPCAVSCLRPMKLTFIIN
jgi:hypothetical protein